jgi:hypothetical protein
VRLLLLLLLRLFVCCSGRISSVAWQQQCSREQRPTACSAKGHLLVQVLAPDGKSI